MNLWFQGYKINTGALSRLIKSDAARFICRTNTEKMNLTFNITCSNMLQTLSSAWIPAQRPVSMWRGDVPALNWANSDLCLRDITPVVQHRFYWLIISQFNGTSTPKGSYRAKTGGNDCNVNSSHYSLRTALCESIRYQAKSEQNVRQDWKSVGIHPVHQIIQVCLILMNFLHRAERPIHSGIICKHYWH